MRKMVTSAVATLGLFVFGAVNSANAGRPVSGGEKGHGPVVNSPGKIGKESGKFDKNKFDKERKEWEYKYWNRYTRRYDYCFPGYSYPVETCAPVCEVPVMPQPVCEVPVCPSRSACRRPATNTPARTISASRMSSASPATTAAIRGTASGRWMAASRRPPRRTATPRTSAAWAATAWPATRRVAGDGSKRRDCEIAQRV